MKFVRSTKIIVLFGILFSLFACTSVPEGVTPVSKLVKKAENYGFDTNKLIFVRQRPKT